MFGPTRNAERTGPTTDVRPALPTCPGLSWAGAFFHSPMTSADSLLPILRRLDEIERKRPHTGRATDPHGHRLFGAPGQSFKEGLKVGWWRCCWRHSNGIQVTGSPGDE